VAGPTTEVLNEDIKEVKADLHEIRVECGVLRSGLQHVNDDIRELKAECREIRGDVAVIKMGLQNVALALGELRGEFRSSDPRKTAEDLATLKGEYKAVSSIAKWVGAFLITSVVTIGGAGVWWASKLTADVRALEGRFDKFETRFDKLESKFDKLESQFDKFGVQLGKLVEQRQMAQPIPKAEGPSDSIVK
jgi:predicted nuclease with TOPRIM domain